AKEFQSGQESGCCLRPTAGRIRIWSRLPRAREIKRLLVHHASPLAIVSVLIKASHCQFFSSESEPEERPLIHLGNRLNHQCDHHYFLQDLVTIEGNVKVTTAPEPGAAQRRTICKTPLVPFGKLTQDRRGINFWYLRLKITQLLSGQKLHIVNTETSEIPKEVENDQMYDLSDTSHTYPAILYMKYRYVVFYWEDARVSGQENHVNITVSTYAKFNDTVNNTMQMDLCNRYGNTWCSKPLASICMGPNSCSLQDDCFDLFSEPSRCSDFLWINGSLTIAGSSLRTTGWILRNLPWFALGAVPLVLVVALAKICSQRRDLDIDDDYEYKLSCSDHPDTAAYRNGDAVHGCLEGDEEVNEDEDEIGDEESSTSSDGEPSNRTARDPECDKGDGNGATYYSYPTAVVPSEAPTFDEQESSADPEESSPPPPPPRLSHRQSHQQQPEGSSANTNNRVLHRLTEVSLEDDEEEGAGANRKSANCDEDEEEEEFVNVEYLRQHPVLPPSSEAGRTVSGEYTKAESTDSPQRDSYTRLLSQPSPDTIKELLKPSPQQGPPSYDEALMGCKTATKADSSLVYAQLVLPPPNRSQPAGQSAAAAATPAASPPPSESLELQAVKAPKPARGTYDSNYIVV
uniref:CUB domain-containing protein n=1 Tax=Macrostomum lignano TaxID=282301 RepID=A0A1I8G914_9PLAT